MASKVSKRKKKTKHARKYTDFPDAYLGFLCSNISGDWFAFGKTIGFQHDHLVKLQCQYPSNNSQCAEIMLREWEIVAENHTTKLRSLLYFGLLQVREDLAKEMLKTVSCDVPSAEDKQQTIWDDLTDDLKKINFEKGSNQGSTDNNVYNITQCNNVIIGCCNTQHITYDTAEANKPLDDQRISDQLKGILLSTDNIHEGMKLQKLESNFMKNIGHGSKAFTFIAGRKLKSFLENAKDFELKFNKDAEQYTVYLKLSQGSSNKNSMSLNDSVASGFADDVEEGNEWTKVGKRSKKKHSRANFDSLKNDHYHSGVKPVTKSHHRSYASVVGQHTFSTPAVETTRRNITTPRPTLISKLEDEDIPKFSTNVDDFLKKVKNFSRGYYILFTAQKEFLKHMEKLALVPWLCVFDLCESSRKDGLLSVMEDNLKDTRSLYVCTWKDPSRILHHGTQWCLLQGSVQEADSRTPKDPKKWFKIIRQDYERHLGDLVSFIDNYSTLKVILLWPDEYIYAECMYKAVSKMEEYIDDFTTIVCDSKQEKDSDERAILRMMNPNFTIQSSLEDLFMAIHRLLGHKIQRQQFEYRLPTSDGANKPQIDESTASLLKEDLDVLFIENPYKNDYDLDFEELKKAEDTFYKGGNLSWRLFYELGAGHLDAERDQTMSIIERIKGVYVRQFKSGIITIYHSPGSGCTTMVQRILWELRQDTPCAEIRMTSRSSLQIIFQQIETLFDKTKLPLVLLIDGDDQQRVNHLFKLIDNSHTVAILINTKRYPYKMMEMILKEDHFRLTGNVSLPEAKKLWKKFDSRCDSDQKKDNLSKLVTDTEKSKFHCMYEFGLVTYLQDYKGIDAYIKGYLLFDNAKQGLQPWQKILGYLSLVYYYGHTSMPCQFFVDLLSLPSLADVTFDHFPYQVQQFIVTSNEEGKPKTVRLCHYVLAKGILEHLLSPNQQRRESESRNSLGNEARNNLHAFVLEFIDDVKARRPKGAIKTSVLIDVLTRTIIYRDNLDIGEQAAVRRQTKRPTLSRLLSDINCQPPYTERVNIIKKLTEAFPEDPNFQAHLGRMYSICRPEEEGKAENCFEHALDLCRRRTKGINNEDLDESTKHTLKHVYHMFGMFNLQRITKYTGRTHGDRPDVQTTKDEFQRRLNDLLDYSEKACKYFQQTRELSMFGYIEAYGYTGEISVRLRICEFINRQMAYKDFDELLKAPSNDSTDYVLDCVTIIQELFLQCYGTIDIDDLPQEFFDSIHWYNTLFKGHSHSLGNLNLPESIYQRRLKVAAIKLRYGKEDVLPTLENISSSQDIAEIVKICEQNFRETVLQGIQLSRRALDLEYKDWIHAIRHELFKTTYSLEDVVRHVRHWHNTLQSPTSKFYLFIILSILGFGVPGGSPNDEMLKEAHVLQQQLKKLSKHLAKPRKPREWLGRGPGIKDLVLLGRRIHRNDDDGFSTQKEEGSCHMAIMRGTICRPNMQRQTGYIKLDLGDKNHFTVNVFFVPVRTSPPLVGRQYAGKRVEFVMAFTNADGYEAYNVTELQTYSCQCGRKTEIQSDEYMETCKCGKKVVK